MVAKFRMCRAGVDDPLLVNAIFNPLQPDGYCGDHDIAESAIVPLIEAAELRPFDAGPRRYARYLEAMAMLWIDPGAKRGRVPSFGFRTLERTGPD